MRAWRGWVVPAVVLALAGGLGACGGDEAPGPGEPGFVAPQPAVAPAPEEAARSTLVVAPSAEAAARAGLQHVAGSQETPQPPVPPGCVSCPPPPPEWSDSEPLQTGAGAAGAVAPARQESGR
jgi:hypothetical protein